MFLGRLPSQKVFGAGLVSWPYITISYNIYVMSYDNIDQYSIIIPGYDNYLFYTRDNMENTYCMTIWIYVYLEQKTVFLIKPHVDPCCTFLVLWTLISLAQQDVSWSLKTMQIWPFKPFHL